MMVGCPPELWRGCAPLPRAERAGTRQALADALYGPVPQAPDWLRCQRRERREDGFSLIEIEIGVADRRFAVQAALWLPHQATGPVPLIIGLDFLGPFGILPPGSFAADPQARVYAPPEWQADGELIPALAGQSRRRWPLEQIAAQGFGLLVSCYGSWVPDDPDACRYHGLYPLLGQPETGAISLWAWALMRLADVAVDFPEIDARRLSICGHSRLGKAALWAGAHDPRIAAIWANNSGCAGAAPARHPVGERLCDLVSRFPHWLRRDAITDPAKLPVDQHQLLALCAPKALYLSEAEVDVWADPLGSYFSLSQAALAWGQKTNAHWPDPASIPPGGWSFHAGALGYHLRPGGHDVLVQDWTQVLAFLSEQLGNGD